MVAPSHPTSLQAQTMTTSRSRAFPAPAFGTQDEPLRLPRKSRRNDIRIEAGRQLRLGLWLVLVLTLALGATLASRPQAIAPGEPREAALELRPATTAALHAPAGRLVLAEIR